jgi:hypothetical protein
LIVITYTPSGGGSTTYGFFPPVLP